MIVKGVIFDFNGTMFYDNDIQENSWRTFLHRKTGRNITDNEFHEYVHGRNAENSLQYFLGRKLSSDEMEQLAEEKEILYRALCMQDKSRFKLMDGLTEFLDMLRKDKTSFTIATASGFNNVTFFFRHLALDKWFDIEKVIYDDGTLPGKPQPDMYQKAAWTIGVLPENCVVFEDTKAGVLAAERAGIGKIVGVAKMISQSQLKGMAGLCHIIPNFYNAYSIIYE